MDPHYKMDPRIKPDDPVSVGVDCSRYEYLRYKWASVGMMRRVTSYDMAHGLGGWTGFEVSSLDDVDEHDMIWWTWSETPHKEHSHVGHFSEGEMSGLYEVSHMSAGRGRLVTVPFAHKLKSDHSRIRRIEVK